MLAHIESNALLGLGIFLVLAGTFNLLRVFMAEHRNGVDQENAAAVFVHAALVGIGAAVLAFLFW